MSMVFMLEGMRTCAHDRASHMGPVDKNASSAWNLYSGCGDVGG